MCKELGQEAIGKTRDLQRGGKEGPENGIKLLGSRRTKKKVARSLPGEVRPALWPGRGRKEGTRGYCEKKLKEEKGKEKSNSRLERIRGDLAGLVFTVKTSGTEKARKRKNMERVFFPLNGVGTKPKEGNAFLKCLTEASLNRRSRVLGVFPKVKKRPSLPNVGGLLGRMTTPLVRE